MKVFTFKYEPNAAKSAVQKLKAAWRTKKPDLIDKDTLLCDSVEAMSRLMTDARFALIEAVKQHSPGFIYELAKLVERDQANVFRDVKALTEIGILSLESEKDGERERSKPILNYDKIIFEMEPAEKVSGL